MFNQNGTVNITSSTFSDNSVQGGTGGNDAEDGSGYGGAVFNYNGTVTENNVTYTNNTNGDVYNYGTGTTGAFCDTVSEIPSGECEALVALYNETGGNNWTNNTDWLQTPTVCNWYGVMCNSGHVSRLELRANQLNGNIPPELGNLTNLQHLDLFTNQLSGSIPPELGNLTNVQYFGLSENQLTGSIPPELGNLSNALYFALFDNQLNGSIPPELGSLANLQELGLFHNQLSGSIPPELGSLTNLRYLYLWDNQLSGSIPPELGNLANLQRLNLHNNQLSGTIPAELSNLVNLQVLDLHSNQLSGRIPDEVCHLLNLEELYLSNNSALSGPLPECIACNLSLLHILSFSDTQLCESEPVQWCLDAGSISSLTRNGVPCTFCDSVTEIPKTECEALTALYDETGGDNWYHNTGWKETYTPCSWYGVTCENGTVTHLDLFNNRLEGSIPAQIGNLSGLKEVHLYNNKLSGSIPAQIGRLENLEILNLYKNAFSGSLPTELGGLSKLRYIDLYNNQLSGAIPSELGNLSNLEKLYLNYNPLSGALPEELTNLTGVQEFYFNSTDVCEPQDTAMQEWLDGISDMQSSGAACGFSCGNVTEISQTECNALVALYNSTDGTRWYNNTDWLYTTTPCNWHGVTCSAETDPPTARSVIELNLGDNNLSGSIPGEIDDFSSLKKLHLWQNQLSGNIPVEIGNLSTLEYLDLSENQLAGDIPVQIGMLSNLKYLALFTNTLTGPIPAEIGGLSNLEILDLYSNQLSGAIPFEAGDLPNVVYIDLYNNQLTGSIPSGIFYLPKLEKLYLNFNPLRGPLPTTAELPATLPPLQEFYFNGTDVCQPAGAEWLNSVAIVESTRQDCSRCDAIENTDVPRAECKALEALYTATDGAHWANTQNVWFATDTPCGWHGVTCTDGHVTALNLSGNHLNGRLVPELSELTDLHTLDLSTNELLTGSIPLNIGALRNLETLDMRGCGLSGNMPPELGKLGNLQHFDLSENALSGTIPAEFTTLAQLNTLQLHHNQLSGSIPRNLMNLPALAELSLTVNPGLCEPSDAAFQDWLASNALFLGSGTQCAENPFIITASANTGGSISPSGAVEVDQGWDQTFTITPEEGYTIADVLVDTLSVGRRNTYTFGNVQANHAITVIFAGKTTYVVDGGVNDVNKNSMPNDKDDDFCWAAAAANILEWGGWGMAALDTAENIYQNFIDNWSGGGGLMNYAWDWWISGFTDAIPGSEEWAQAAEASGGYWADYNFFELYADSPYGFNTMDYVDYYLRNDYGVSVTAYGEVDGEEYYHALSVWGIEYDAGTPTGLWVTDPSDYDNYPDPRAYWLSLEFDKEHSRWYFSDDENGNEYYDAWSLTGAVALKQRGKLLKVSLSGNGRVTSSAPGIDCEYDCTETYNTPTVVTLLASPDPGTVFLGWSGGGCSGTNECVVMMHSDQTITAEFSSAADLAGHWKFDETYGDLALDSSGNERNGTIFGAKQVIGKYGGALDFSGNPDAYVTLPGNFEDYVSDHFTITLWANVSNSKHFNYLFTTSDKRPSITLNDENDGRVGYQLADGEPLPQPFPTQQLRPLPQTGEWAHIACTWDGARFKGYVNGEVRTETGLSVFTLGKQIFIGTDGTPENSFDGLIDDVRIYNRALSAEEIRADTLYTITAIAGPRGSISPAGALKVKEGRNQTFSIFPDAGHEMLELLIDGDDRKEESFLTASGTLVYMFENVSADHTIEAVFLAPEHTFTITAESEGEGRISPAGSVKVEQGADQTFSFEPVVGYRVANVIVKSGEAPGEPVGPSKTYTFTNVTENHQLTALFIKNTERLGIARKKCYRTDEFGNRTEEVECGEEINGTITAGGQVVCDADCSMFVAPFSPLEPLILNFTPNDNSTLICWESIFGECIENGVYFAAEDFVVNPIIGRNSYVGNSHGGNSHGGNSHGGNSHGGNSHGGNSHGGNSHGGNSHGGNSHGGNSHGGNSHGGTEQG